MKKILFVIVVLLALLFVLSLAKNSIAKASVEKICHSITGLELKIKRLNIGILNTLLEVKGLKMMNPPSYEDRVMFDVPEIYVDYNLKSIIGGKVHLEEVRLDLKELMVIKSADGKLNLDYLKPSAKEGKPQQEPSEPGEPTKKPAKKSKAPEIQIDKLSLRVGKVIYKDYTQSPPLVRQFDVNLNETHENITDIRALVPLIVGRALVKTTIASLTNFDIDQMMSNFNLDGLGDVGSGVGDTAKNIFSTLKDVGSDASNSDAVGKAVDGVKGLLGAFTQ